MKLTMNDKCNIVLNDKFKMALKVTGDDKKKAKPSDFKSKIEKAFPYTIKNTI